jgi:hypothetical protein
VSNREYVRKVLENEVDLRANGPDFVAKQDEPVRSLAYREQMNSEGSPSRTATAGYIWMPGGELTRVPRRREKAA